MSIINDLNNLSSRQRRIILRAAGKLLRELPTTHTITINRKPGIDNGREITDFELTVFVNAESEAESKRIVSESVYRKGRSAVPESYRTYDPGFAYIQSERAITADEAEALTFEYAEVYENSRQAYLKFVEKHIKLFVKGDCISVITINAPEMEKSNPLYYALYTINRYKTGYVVYNRDIQPIITIQKQV